MKNNDIDILNKKHIDDFKRAIDIYEQNYKHEEIISLIQNGSIVEKQIAALKLDSINSPKDAETFIQNLTGCDGKIREAVSFRLEEFVKKNPEYFEKYVDIFLEAIVDINGNICRNTIGSLKYQNEMFKKEFCAKLLEKTLILSKSARNFDIQDGKYKINKEIFKLYWYLETVYELVEYINSAQLVEIVNNTKEIFDYTIREKTAKILCKINDEKLNSIKQKLKNDENYYVRRF